MDTPNVLRSVNVGVVSRQFDKRRSYRSGLYLWALFRQHGRTTRIKLIVTDLSVGGCRLRPAEDLAPGDAIFIEVPGYAPVEARIAWRSNDRRDYGCRFVALLAQPVVDHIARSCRNAVGACRAA